MSSYTYDSLRRALVVDDARLTKVLQREPESCAAVSEYAQKTGIETGQVLQLLAPAVDDGVLMFEIYADEIFVHTAPEGRPTPRHKPEVAPNLWERLRDRGTPEEAYTLWRLYRGLQDAGWRVEANPNQIMFGLSSMAMPPALGIRVAHSMVPLIIHPTVEHVAHPQGLLSMYEHAGAAAVGVICDSGALDDMVTAVRRWVFEKQGHTKLAVVILEAPRYAPTLLTATDASVAPRSLSREAFTQQVQASGSPAR